MQERADELHLYSSSSTTVFTSQAHWRWMNTSTARQECATLSLYTTSRTTDRYRTDAVVCWLPKLVDVCGYDTRRAGLPGNAAGSSAGTVFTRTSSIQSIYPYLCTAVLGYSTLPWR